MNDTATHHSSIHNIIKNCKMNMLNMEICLDQTLKHSRALGVWLELNWKLLLDERIFGRNRWWSLTISNTHTFVVHLLPIPKQDKCFRSHQVQSRSHQAQEESNENWFSQQTKKTKKKRLRKNATYKRDCDI